MNTASTVRDAPKVCPARASSPREKTSCAPTVAASRAGEVGPVNGGLYRHVSFSYLSFYIKVRVSISIFS